MSVEERRSPLTLDCPDGYALHGSLFTPRPGAERGVTVIVCPAIGVRQRFYWAFAAALADAGFHVLSLANRGMDVSLAAEDRPWPHELRHWGEVDLPAIVAHARAARPGDRLFVVGHSMGGQLVGLSDSLLALDGVVTVAATAAWWGHWSFPANVGILAWDLAMPVLGRIFPRFPAERLRLGPDIDARLMRDWVRWGRDRDYLFAERFGLPSHLDRYRGRVLAFSFSDDPFGSRAAVDALHRRFTAAELVERHVAPAEVGARRLGHFGYFRRAAGEPLWRETIAWMGGGASA
jgi:predicted alpha/beta hydrolase